MRGKPLILAITTVMFSMTSLHAGNLDAEAGGPHQQERAEREWARESRETRERVERDVRAQEAERAAARAQAAKAEATQAASTASAATAVERHLPGLTLTKQGALNTSPESRSLGRDWTDAPLTGNEIDTIEATTSDPAVGGHRPETYLNSNDDPDLPKKKQH